MFISSTKFSTVRIILVFQEMFKSVWKMFINMDKVKVPSFGLFISYGLKFSWTFRRGGNFLHFSIRPNLNFFKLTMSI